VHADAAAVSSRHTYGDSGSDATPLTEIEAIFDSRRAPERAASSTSTNSRGAFAPDATVVESWGVKVVALSYSLVVSEGCPGVAPS
jgi:hypothetical protein